VVDFFLPATFGIFHQSVLKRFFMKHLVFGLWTLTLIAFFSSCKKDATQKDNNTSVIGTWELRDISGGMMPGSIKFAPGNGNILKLSSTDYGIYKSNQLIKSGTYKIVADTTVEQNVCLIIKDGEFTNRIDYSDTTSIKIFFQLDGSKLVFQSGCYAVDGGHSEVYQKIAAAGMKD